ncbi:MAG: RsmB/NOP family class I SAM-dependent RNA methyltransferase [Candidatus Avoscillospira sp.]
MLPPLFLERMEALLGPEYEEFLASYDRPRNVGLRINPLKTDSVPDLSAFGLTPVPWAEHGFYYDIETRPGLSPYHEAGLYYLQEPSAMAPAGLLDVRPGMRVLDLCAAPGGKTTQLAAALRGRGLLVCNEINPKRAKILARNIERLGIANALVLNEHPQKLEERFEGWFDRILVDAPCSGEGMFRKEEAAVTDWSPETVDMCARRQLEILRSAARMLAPGGRLVYSTCTFAPQENEGVISRFLETEPDFSVANADAPWFMPGRPDWIEDPAPGIEHTFRLWPHKLHGEGHFAAILEKNPDAPVGAATSRPYGSPGGRLVAAPTDLMEFCKETGAALPEGRLLAFGQSLFWVPEETPDLKGLKVLRPGLELGEILKNRFEPAHAWALWLKTAHSTVDFPADSPEIAAYLRGETISGQAKGWTLLTVDGLSLGWVKGSGGILKNHFPKALRHLA